MSTAGGKDQIAPFGIIVWVKMMSHEQLSVTFHIGMPRAGSTSLQLNLFSQDSLFVQYGDPNAPKQPWHKGGLGIPIPPEGESGIESVREEMIEASKSAAGKIFAISDESFLSVNTRLSDQEIFAKRIKSLGFDSKVVIITRKQEDIILSRYRQLQTVKAWSVLGFPYLPTLPVPKGIGKNASSVGFSKYFLRMPSFSEWFDMAMAGIYANWFSNLFYDRVYEAYSSVLGIDKVLVLPYEKYKYDLQGFSGDLSSFLGMREKYVYDSLNKKMWNRSDDRKWERVFSPAKKNGLGVLNSIRLAFDGLMGKGGLKPDLKPRQKEVIKSVFGPSNRRLERLSSANILEHGYAE